MGSGKPAGGFSVGLTGGIGSGKSIIADMFESSGASIIDSDLISHALTGQNGKAMPAIHSHFGAEYVLPDGAMNRMKMRDLIFSDRAAKFELEKLLHPLILTEALSAAGQAKGSYVIFVIPLLVESRIWRQRVSRVLVVDCPEEMQICRVRKRNALDESQIKAIMAAQSPRSLRLEAADDVITNDGERSALLPQVEHLHSMYKDLAKANAAKQSQHL